MGRFFTSTQINNPKQLNCDGFKAYFCEKMKKEGYEVCEADCAELSYVLAFSENCKWVTLSSEAYEQGNRTAQADTARIAKMLKTTCINTTVIDSDCAMLDLYDDKGKKADTLVMGRADDYLGDDIPAPAQAVWEQFVSPDSTWEQFMSVVQGDYVFVEDGLSELAPVIGMDSDNILFEYEDADESNEKLCYLSFKKTASKKEKKPTLNSLFQQIWGAELEPLGFKKPKLRYPYYIRVINDEIIHIVGIHDMKSHLVAFGGIATVYRQELCLDKTYRQNEYWLKDIDVLYHKLHISDKPFHQEIESGFYYHEYIESQPLSKAVQDALNETMTWIVPVLDNIKTLKDVADYEERVFKNYISIISLPLNESLAAPYSDAAIKFILDDPLADLEQRYLTSLKLVDEENIRYNRTQEYILRNQKEYEQRYNESCKNLHMFLEDEEMHSQTLEELARRKKANLEMLKSYGIDSEKPQPKKEKKPTLNSLFQQIWGAELEPLGFKKPKLRLPYYIRVINDEIIHVVGIHDMKSHLVAFGGIATVYRKELCLNHSFRQNEMWLRDVMDFYVKWRISDKPFNQEIQSGFHYHEYIESQPLSKAVQDALNETMTWIVPVLDNIKTLKDVADYEERVFKDYISIISLPLQKSLAEPYSDAAIRFILDDPLADLEQRYLHFVKNTEEVNKRFNRPQEIIEKDRIFIEEMLKDSRERLHMFLEDKELHSQTLEELARRKKANLELLKSYGIDSEKPQPKKEKKLTINAAFKQVFGELLEPMGFKLIKSKYPYYLRVVGEGIIQAISFTKKKSLNLDLNRDEEEVEIYVGISLLSNPLINFDKNPTIIDNQVWMISLNELYRRFIVYMDGFNRKHEEYSFFYQKGNIEEVLNALKQSRDELMPFVLEFLEKPKTLEDIYRLGEITSGIRHDTIILLQKIDELIKELKENLTKKIEMLESVHKDNPERLELLKKRAIEGSEKSIEYFGSFKKGGEKYDSYIKTAEKTKEDNLEKLKQLGII